MHIEYLKQHFEIHSVIAMTSFFFGLMTTRNVFTMCCLDKARCSAVEISPSFSTWSKTRL